MDQKKARMSEEAMAAVEVAFREGHSVFCLEGLGVPQRVINLLYDSGLRSVADVVSKSHEQLLEIPNMGLSQIGTVIRALERYHTIEDV